MNEHFVLVTGLCRSGRGSLCSTSGNVDEWDGASEVFGVVHVDVFIEFVVDFLWPVRFRKGEHLKGSQGSAFANAPSRTRRTAARRARAS